MGRLTYVCATCEEHFTRRYSATRLNLTIHNNRGEIVSLLEYLVGRSSGQYRPSHPFSRRSDKRIHRYGDATTVADPVGDTFRTGGQVQYQRHQQSLEDQEKYQQQQQQQQQQQHQSQFPAIQKSSPYPTDQEYQSQSMNTTDDEETTTISHETRLKIEELKRLVYRYREYHFNPDAVIKWAICCCNDGDNTFLDEKLEQLRMFESAMGYRRM